jgi:hypothetical protein
MKFELDDYHRNISDKDLISDLKCLAEELKRSPTMEDYKERGKYSCDTYCRRFGGWLKALKIAGLKATRSPINIPVEDLFMNLEEVWIKLERQPRYNEIQKPLSKFSAGTYEKRFGSWRKALEAFVNYMNEEGSVSSYEGIKKLKVELSTKHKTKRDMNWRLRFLVLKRDNFKCKACGCSLATDQKIVLHVDHIKAWANGGETVLENLQTLCSKCNIGKSNVL